MLIAFDTPDAGTAACAETGRGSYEAVRALLIQCASVNCPLSLGVLASRNLTIERVAADGGVLSSATYAVPSHGGSDRTLTFNLDVAVHPKASVRAKFDYCSGSETQWIVINYEFVGT